MSPKSTTIEQILTLADLSRPVYGKHLAAVIGRTGRLIRQCPRLHDSMWEYAIWHGLQPNPMQIDWALFSNPERLTHAGARALYERLRFGRVQWPVWLCADYRGTKSRVGDWSEAVITNPETP